MRAEEMPAGRIYVACFIGVVAVLFAGTRGSAQSARIQVPGAPGLYRKVVVCKNGATLHDTPRGPGEPVSALSVFYLLEAGEKGKDQKDGFVHVGTARGAHVGWIKKEQVICWNTRLLLVPKPTDTAARFTVFEDEDLKRPLAQYSGAKAGQRAVALILEKPKADDNPVFKVAFFSPTITQTRRKALAGKYKSGPVKPEEEIYDATPMEASVYRIINAAKGKEFAVQTGFAKLYAGHRRVAVVGVLVSQREFRRYAATLHSVIPQLSEKVEPIERNGVDRLLAMLQSATASLVTWESVIAKGDTMYTLIASLPVQTNVLKISSETVESYTKADFQHWLDRLRKAHKNIVLIDNRLMWFGLSGGKSKEERYTILYLRDLM